MTAVFGSCGRLWLAGFVLGTVLPSAYASSQISFTYGLVDPNLSDVIDPELDWEREYIVLNYGLPLSPRLTFGPSLGLVGDETATTTTILTDPDGLSLGLWTRYDLLSYGRSSTYARGGLAYLDYDLEDSKRPNDGTELQLSLGLGTDLAVTDQANFFANLNYTYVDGSQDGAGYEGGETGLEIGIELAF